MTLNREGIRNEEVALPTIWAEATLSLRKLLIIKANHETKRESTKLTLSSRTHKTWDFVTNRRTNYPHSTSAIDDWETMRCARVRASVPCDYERIINRFEGEKVINISSSFSSWAYNNTLLSFARTEFEDCGFTFAFCTWNFTCRPVGRCVFNDTYQIQTNKFQLSNLEARVGPAAMNKSACSSERNSKLNYEARRLVAKKNKQTNWPTGPDLNIQLVSCHGSLRCNEWNIALISNKLAPKWIS